MEGGRKEEGDPVSQMAGQEEVIYGVQRVEDSFPWRGSPILEGSPGEENQSL